VELEFTVRDDARSQHIVVKYLDGDVLLRVHDALCDTVTTLTTSLKKLREIVDTAESLRE
jgi:hypothetical protein